MSGTTGPMGMYRFGDFTLDLERGVLSRSGCAVPLRPKSFHVLSHLVAHGGRLVRKDELLHAVWGDVIVTDDSLTQCLIDIRKALGDDSRRMVRTVPRRGYVFEVPVQADDAPPPPLPPTRTGAPRGGRIVAAAALFCLAAAIAWWVASRPQEASGSTPALPVADPGSIAVLPFVDMSEAQDQEYFADGISEEILNLLAQTGTLHVTARTSSFAFKNGRDDIATIAARLQVAHVLEGSVRRSGHHVRVIAQLVDARTSEQVWSQAYDRELGDILDVQSDIATAVAGVLSAKLAQNRADVTRSTQAYDSYLQARFFFNRRGPGDLKRATQYFERALEIDPDYARAWAGLAGVLHADPHRDMARMQHAVARALALAPDLAEAHVRAANLYGYMGDYPQALEHLRHAMAVDPDNPLVLGTAAGVDARVGKVDRAVARQRLAVRRDPLGFVSRMNLALYLLAAGHLEQCKVELRNARALSPSHSAEIAAQLGIVMILEGHFESALSSVEQWPEGMVREQGRALAYAGLGRQEEADRWLRRLSSHPGTKAALLTAEVYAQRGDPDSAFRWLNSAQERALQQSAPGGIDVLEVRVSPLLRPLHADRRWKAWLARVNVHDVHW